MLSFIEGKDKYDFNQLALHIIQAQIAHSTQLKRFYVNQKAKLDKIDSFLELPPLPAKAISKIRLDIETNRNVTFLSSGTSGERSVHFNVFPELYDTSVLNSFPVFLQVKDKLPLLSLLPDYKDFPNSSLAYMNNLIMTHFASNDSLQGFSTKGLLKKQIVSWLSTRQREKRRVIILGTTIATWQLLEFLKKRKIKFRLLEGSTLFDTGGSKGLRRFVEREQFLLDVEEYLGIDRRFVVREYGMAELFSQCYTIMGRSDDLFFAPEWVRVFILDPLSLNPVNFGVEGFIAVFDCANLGSFSWILTGDIGIAAKNGFKLVGRAPGEMLKGCSLISDTLAF